MGVAACQSPVGLDEWPCPLQSEADQSLPPPLRPHPLSLSMWVAARMPTTRRPLPQYQSYDHQRGNLPTQSHPSGSETTSRGTDSIFRC